jgi:succinate dehydrogenase/fumarate reductase flavoprotein subunit
MNVRKKALTTDILIVGGGVAGCMAAIAARDTESVDVVVLEKASVVRSGDAGAGNDHFLAHLNSGPEWDTDEAMAAYYERLSQGLADVEVAKKLHLSRIGEILDKLESYGIEMKDRATGRYIRTKSFGQPGPYYINFEGKNLKPAIVEQMKQRKVKVINRVNVTGLLHDGRKVFGAMGFNVRTGEFYEVQAKATILALGDATRLWPHPSGLPFNTWMSPFNNGAGYAMAFKAGAELANMEITAVTVVPKGFSAAGLNAFTGMGCYLWNSVGERYMQKYHAMAEGAPRNTLALGTYREYIEGRGPCYIDCRHLSKEALLHLTENLLPVDKDTLVMFFDQKGLHVDRDFIEIGISEMQMAGFTGSVSGIVIDRTGKTTVEGLYAAGACTVPSFALSGAFATGYSVGEETARVCRKLPRTEMRDEEQVNREIERIYAPLRRTEGMNYKRLEDKLRQIMSDYVGYIKNEQGLQAGLKKLEDLEHRVDRIRAKNFHELMRTFEFQDLLLVGKLIATSALARKESRMGLSHLRGDYPNQSDTGGKDSTIIKAASRGIEVSFRPAATNTGRI